MRPAYPEMMEAVQRVARVVKDEEHRYATTFLVAEKVFSDELAKLSGRHGARARSPSSSTTPTGWRSTSRKRWRASAASRSTATASKPKCSSSANARAPAGRAARRARSLRLIRSCSSKGRTKFLGYDRLDAVSTVIGLLVDQQLVDERRRRARRPSWCSTRRRSTPRPADRWAIAASLYRRAYRREGGGGGRHVSGGAGADGASRSATLAPIRVGDELRAEVAAPERLLDAAQSHRDAPAARRAAPGAGAAREAGGQRGGAAAAAFRFHALRRAGSGGNRGNRAAGERADSAEHAGARRT